MLDTNLLKSIEANDIAKVLGGTLIAELRISAPDIADDLDLLSNELFSKTVGMSKSTRRTEIELRTDFHLEKSRDSEFVGRCEELTRKYLGDPKKLRLLSSSYAKLGKILELSGHLARENFFDLRRSARDEALRAFDPDSDEPPPILDERQMLPGGIERILYKMKNNRAGKRVYVFETVDELIDYLNSPKFIPVLTQHPTNLDTLKTNILLREWHDTVREVVQGGEVSAAAATLRLQGIARNFLNNELTPMRNGKLRNFTPHDEVSFVLDSMHQMFSGLDDVYATFDRAIVKRFGSKYAERKDRLHFDYQPASWAMGDKDGNGNIKAEHLLDATVRQRKLVMQLYRVEIRKLKEQGIGISEELMALDQNFAHACAALERAESFLAQKRKASGGVDIVLHQSEFDEIALTLKNALARPGEAPLSFAQAEANFVTCLQQTFDSNKDDPGKSDATLALLRKARTFGLRMGRIELRETSEEYSTVIAYLLQTDPKNKFNYADLSSKKQAKLLDRLICERPGYLKELADNFLAGIEQTDDLRKYSAKDPRVIAYHTLKRLQLAQQNPDMYQDMILAECKGAHHVMEALALQKAVSASTGLDIAPLLEEYTTLNGASRLLMNMLRMKSYRQHILALAGGDPALILQKIQVAHSDNVRRAGTPAARTSIHAIHYDVPRFLVQHKAEILALFREDGVDTTRMNVAIEWFEGGSFSDPLRNGVRSFTAMINAFNLHKVTKATFQGICLHNYFGLSTSFRRLMARFFTHNAKEIAIQDRARSRTATNAQAENGGPVKRIPKIERAIRKAMKGCYEDYKASHFNELSNPLGYLLAHPLINYPLYKIISARASRSPTRGNNTDERTVYGQDIEVGEIRTKITKPIDTKDMRTIPFSSVLNDANIQGSWLGSQRMADHMISKFARCKKSGRRLQKEADKHYQGHVDIFDKHGTLNAAGIKALYDISPSFRDVIDFMGYGLIVSDVERLQKRLVGAFHQADIPVIPEIQHYVVDTLPRDYAAASSLVLAAFGKVPPSSSLTLYHTGAAPLSETCKFLGYQVEQLALPHLLDEIRTKRNYAQLHETMRDQILMRAWKEGRQKDGVTVMRDLTTDEKATLSNIASGVTVFRHGRIFAADDPHYAGEMRHDRQQIAVRRALEPA